MGERRNRAELQRALEEAERRLWSLLIRLYRARGAVGKERAALLNALLEGLPEWDEADMGWKP